jgi:hypothetical protein
MPKLRLEFEGPGTGLEGTVFAGAGLEALAALGLLFTGEAQVEGHGFMGLEGTESLALRFTLEGFKETVGAGGPPTTAAPLFAPPPLGPTAQGELDHLMKAKALLDKVNDRGQREPVLSGLLTRTKGVLASASDPEARFSASLIDGLCINVGVSETSQDAKDLKKLVEERLKGFNPRVRVHLRSWEHLDAVAASKGPEVEERLRKEGISLAEPINFYIGSEDKYAQGTSPRWLVHTDKPVSPALLRELSLVLRDNPRESPRPIQNLYGDGLSPYTHGDVIV